MVVEVEPGEARAFYMSLGKGGTTSEGEWVPFAGRTWDGWFVKASGGKRVEKYQPVVDWLGATYTNNRRKATYKIESEGGLVYTDPDRFGPGDHPTDTEVGQRVIDTAAEYKHQNDYLQKCGVPVGHQNDTGKTFHHGMRAV